MMGTLRALPILRRRRNSTGIGAMGACKILALIQHVAHTVDVADAHGCE